MWSLQNVKLNIGWLCNTFDTCEKRGQIPQPQSTEFQKLYIHIAFPVSLVIIIIITIIIIIKVGTLRIGTYPLKSAGSLRSRDETWLDIFPPGKSLSKILHNNNNNNNNNDKNNILRGDLQSPEGGFQEGPPEKHDSWIIFVFIILHFWLFECLVNVSALWSLWTGFITIHHIFDKLI